MPSVRSRPPAEAPDRLIWPVRGPSRQNASPNRSTPWRLDRSTQMIRWPQRTGDDRGPGEQERSNDRHFPQQPGLTPRPLGRFPIGPAQFGENGGRAHLLKCRVSEQRNRLNVGRLHDQTPPICGWARHRPRLAIRRTSRV